MFSARVSGFVLLLGLLAGCSDQYGGRQEIKGTVKFKAVPIKDGIISFEPLDGQDTRATAMLKDGQFSIPREHGLQPGKYLLRVSAGDQKVAVNPVDADHPPGPGGGTNVISKELIPADWNVRSKQERTVSKDGSNHFDLEIP